MTKLRMEALMARAPLYKEAYAKHCHIGLRHLCGSDPRGLGPTNMARTRKAPSACTLRVTANPNQRDRNSDNGSKGFLW